jgi:hypothetical protein
MVWEGINATANLTAGQATISLAAVRDDECTPWPGLDACQYADRNLDAILLHPNASDIDNRWHSLVDPRVLAFDGLFSQAGEVFFKVANHNTERNMTLPVPLGYFHNPYFAQHLRLGDAAGPIPIAVGAGATSDWVDVGALLDTQQHGTWNLYVGNYSVTVGIKDQPFNRSDGTIVPVGLFDGRPTSNDTQIVWDASIRASRRVRHSAEDFYAIMDSFKVQGQPHGHPLRLTPVYAATFAADLDTGGPMGGGCGGVSQGTSQPLSVCSSRVDPKFKPALTDFKAEFCTSLNCMTTDAPFMTARTAGFALFDGNTWGQISDAVTQAINQSNRECGQACETKTVSLGDEIIVAEAPDSFANTTSFDLYCKQHGITLAMLGCIDSNWTACTNPNANASTAAQHPGLYYWSTKFIHSAGISYWKNYTVFLRELGLTKAKFGANFGPQNYIGYTYQWIRLFREGSFDLPWSE